MDDQEGRRTAWADLEKRIPKGGIPTVECGVGWRAVVDELVAELDAVWEGFMGKAGANGWCPMQVKEKFGSLRLFADYAIPERKAPVEVWKDFEERRERSYAVIEKAENKSAETCERCGAPGKNENVGGWLATVCEVCHKRWQERSKQGVTPSLF